MGELERSKQQTRDFNNFWKDKKTNYQRGGTSEQASYTLVGTCRHQGPQRLAQGMGKKAGLKV